MRFPFASVRDLAPLLGKTHLDPELVRFAEELVIVEQPSLSGEVEYWGNTDMGIILGFEAEMWFLHDSSKARSDVFRLSAISFVNATKEPDYLAYPGPLLDGLVMGSTREEALKALGEPGFWREASDSGIGSCPMDRWDLGTFNFILEYNPATLAAELAQITLYPDKMKIA